MRYRTKSAALAVVTGLSVLLAACSGGASGAGGPGRSSGGEGKPQPGGTLTYLLAGVNTWSRGLDPATAGIGVSNLLNAIYGQLFSAGEDGKIIPELATGYTFSDGGKTVTITLREGVTFQDGTPFDAEAVAWNIKRDLDAVCVCNPSGSWPPLAEQGITTPDDHTVVLHFTKPYAAVIRALMSSSANLIASPTAVRKMGEKQFGMKPVGAGPFKVVQNVVNSQLVLERYDGYWKEGRPYLDKLVFKSIGGDQPAYQAILAGQAQATNLTTPAVVGQASENKSLTVTHVGANSPYTVVLNTRVPPFNDKRAREAIYYATDPEAITTHVFNGIYPVTQSFTGPDGLFYMPKVPGYRAHDPVRAKRIVNELGGLRFDLFAGSTLVLRQTMEALQAQWAESGIKATIHAYDLPRAIQEFQGKKWQGFLGESGALDPAVNVGLPFYFSSDSPYSGVHDAKLDAMMRQAAATLDTKKRAGLYAEIAKYISDQAYAPFLFVPSSAHVAAQGVHGPGITSPREFPLWDDVWVAKEAR